MPCWQPRAVLFLEKVAPTLEHVDSSSGAIGTAVNHAIAEFISIIARAPADVSGRAKWLERLRDADVADAIPYIETLGDFWGELCVTKELSSLWADNLIEALEATWRAHGTASYFQGTPVCLSSLLAAGRYQGLLDLLEKAPSIWWEYRRWGVQALAAMGKPDEALRYAEASRGLNDNLERIARTCEEVLLAQGRSAEAYERYALASNRGTSNIATYRSIVRKYPERDPRPRGRHAGRRGQVVCYGQGGRRSRVGGQACESIALRPQDADPRRAGLRRDEPTFRAAGRPRRDPLAR